LIPTASEVRDVCKNKTPEDEVASLPTSPPGSAPVEAHQAEMPPLAGAGGGGVHAELRIPEEFAFKTRHGPTAKDAKIQLARAGIYKRLGNGPFQKDARGWRCGSQHFSVRRLTRDINRDYGFVEDSDDEISRPTVIRALELIAAKYTPKDSDPK
jgi:hypothetical protein